MPTPCAHSMKGVPPCVHHWLRSVSRQVLGAQAGRAGALFPVQLCAQPLAGAFFQALAQAVGGVQPGVVRRQAEAGRTGGACAELQALHHGAVHVLVLVLVQGPPGHGAGQHGHHRLLDAVVQQRGLGAKARAVPAHTEVPGVVCFGPQRGVAEVGVRALALLVARRDLVASVCACNGPLLPNSSQSACRATGSWGCFMWSGSSKSGPATGRLHPAQPWHLDPGLVCRCFSPLVGDGREPWW